MKTILVGGCFDLIHIGHIYFLEKTKNLGGRLVVLLESDETIKKFKGDQRPIHSQAERKKMLLATKFVDEVISLPPLKTDKDYVDIIQKIHPDIIALTEGDPILDKKQKQADSIGAQLVIIPKIHTPSTSQLAKLLRLE